MKYILSNLLLPVTLLNPEFDVVAKEQLYKPNIVVVFIDDLGYNDLGFRNSSFTTPNIDKFVAENLNFTHAYVPSPTSSPSRAGLLTGIHPLRIGLVRHIDENEKDPNGSCEYGLSPTDPGNKYNRKQLPLEHKTFASTLKEEGYTTYHIGKWHLGKSSYYPDKHGFDFMVGESDLGNPTTYYPPYFTHGKVDLQGDYLTDKLTTNAIRIIDKHDYTQSPLLMYFAHYAVHTPHIGKENLVNKYLARGLDKEYAIYHAMVESMDESFGRVIETLQTKGVYENTVVFFISDQGGYFTNTPLKGGKMDWPLHEGGCRVPFFVHYPGAKTPRVITERITTLDLYPTLLQLSNRSEVQNENLDGQSLVASFEGNEPRPQPLFFYRSYENQYASVIYDNMKYIITRNGCDIVYDLLNDEAETTNLYGDVRYEEDQKKLKSILSDFLSKYDTTLYYRP